MPRLLTPELRRQLIVRVFDCWEPKMLRALEREIARRYAATPEQRAANEEHLRWLRPVALARRSHLGCTPARRP